MKVNFVAAYAGKCGMLAARVSSHVAAERASFCFYRGVTTTGENGQNVRREHTNLVCLFIMLLFLLALSAPYGKRFGGGGGGKGTGHKHGGRGHNTTHVTSKKAFITGITGQDGSYLAELLLSKGYEVHGMVRRSSSWNRHRIEHLSIQLHYGDLTDSNSCHKVMTSVRPDEVYNLGAQSHVGTSFETSEYTGEVDALGVTRLLNAIRDSGLAKTTRFYQASTSELFGRVREVPQSEATFFYPRSPYGVAKMYAYWIVVNYREERCTKLTRSPHPIPGPNPTEWHRFCLDAAGVRNACEQWHSLQPRIAAPRAHLCHAQDHSRYGCWRSSNLPAEHPLRHQLRTCSREDFCVRCVSCATGVARIAHGLQDFIPLGNLDARRDWGHARDYVVRQCARRS